MSRDPVLADPGGGAPGARTRPGRRPACHLGRRPGHRRDPHPGDAGRSGVAVAGARRSAVEAGHPARVPGIGPRPPRHHSGDYGGHLRRGVDTARSPGGPVARSAARAGTAGGVPLPCIERHVATGGHAQGPPEGAPFGISTSSPPTPNNRAGGTAPPSCSRCSTGATTSGCPSIWSRRRS